MSNKPHDIPTTATAEAGEVMLDGPDGLAISFTPEAALKSADSMAEAASKAGLKSSKSKREEKQ